MRSIPAARRGDRHGKTGRTARRLRPKIGTTLDGTAIFYAWYRLGLPSQLGDLWTTPTATLLHTLSSAIEQGIVPAPDSTAPLSLRARIERLKSDHARKHRKPRRSISAQWRDLLATLPARLRPAQRRLATAAVARLRADDPQLRERIEEFAAFRDHAVVLSRTMRLASLTGRHLPVIAALQRRLVKMDEREGTLRPLAALRPDEWVDLVYTHGAPDGSTITPAAYADALAHRVEDLHPGDALLVQFSQRRRLSRHPALREVAIFLSDNPGVDILTGDLSSILRKAKPRRRSKRREEELIAGLRTIQRVNALGASWEEAAALLENDLYSPAQLLAAGVHEVTRRLKGQLSLQRVSHLCRKAALVLAGSLERHSKNSAIGESV